MDGELPLDFSVEEKERWDSMVVQKGHVIEASLPIEEDGSGKAVLAAFLVQKVLLSVTGDLLLIVKSLGSEDAGLSRRLSNCFNRRKGTIHLCGGACTVMENHPLHLGAIRLHSSEDYESEFMTSYGKKNISKWLEEDVTASGEEGRDFLDIDGQEISEEEVGKEEVPEPPPRSSKRKPGAGDRAVRRTTPAGSGVPDPKQPRGDKKEQQIDKDRLKQRLAALRERMTGAGPRGSAALPALPPLDAEAPDGGDLSSPDDYTPSVADQELCEGTQLPPERKRERKTTEEQGQKKRPRDGEGKRKQPNYLGPLEDTRDVTMSSLQTQLVKRAADTAQRKAEERRAEKKRQKKKDPSAQLLKILTQARRSSKRKDKEEDSKKDKKKKKKKRTHGRGGGSDGSGDPSPSSPTSSYGGNSSGASGDRSSSESKDMAAPLKKRSREKPGSVLGLLVEHARQQLDQTGKVAVHAAGKENPTKGVKLSSYFSIVVRPQLGQLTGPVREMHLLANGLDLLRQGDLDVLGDLLASRFMSVHQSILDGGWNTARHMELMPLEDNTAAGSAIVLQARKHAKLAAKLQHQEFWTGSSGARGRGGRGKGQAWGDSQWGNTSEGKGKGKKGGKGKGKGKGAWGAAPGGEGDGQSKTKERLPDK